MSAAVFVEGSPRLACSVQGSGPPVVFLHGVGGRRQNWDRQVQRFAAEFTTIAWDARGYGDSDPVGPAVFGDFADDLVRLLDQCGIDRAHLVGLSMGGRILLEFADQNLDRIATLTLCDCFPSFAAALSPDAQRNYVELRERPLREGRTFADLAPALVDSLVAPDADAAVRAELGASIEALRVEPYLATIRASVGFDRTRVLSRIDVPVQLIFGRADRLTPPAIGESMLAELADARLAVIEGAGHLVNIERPDEFNATLARFLDDFGPRARFAASPPRT